MSFTYEFQLSFNFIEPLPDTMVEAMEYLCGNRAVPPKIWPEPDDIFIHPKPPDSPLLFDLAKDHDSRIKSGNTICSFRRLFRYTHHGKDHYRYTLHFRCFWHDDHFGETWWRLVPWMAKFSDADGCVGYYQERYDIHPQLIYFRQGKVYLLEVKGTPLYIIDGQPW